MPTMVSSTQWLLKMAQRASLQGAEDFTPDTEAEIEDVWGSLASACNLSIWELAGEVAAQYGTRTADLGRIEPTALRLVPERVAREHLIFPLHEDDESIVIATADPSNPRIEQIVRFSSGRNPVFLIAPPNELARIIEENYSLDHAVAGLLGNDDGSAHEISVLTEAGPEDVSSQEAEGSSVIRLTNVILADAVNRGASDLHFEPGRSGATVRFRIDGVLQHYMQMPLPALSRVTSRIKIMAQLDIANRLRPQDGKARIRVRGRAYDLRVSTVPVHTAEKVVIRVLDTEGDVSLTDLGMPVRELERFRRLLTQRDSVVVVTGPTGSGKTTTFYGALQELATGEVNIVTVENPIEYELDGITQIQVEEKRGVTFASALRAILRQDPDIIMIGEIRDPETASIAIQASLTGHLVLATLHTNDAIGVVSRFLDLGIDRPAISESVRGAIAQRLVRKLCTTCAIEVSSEEMTEEEKESARKLGTQQIQRAVGCEECGQTGFRGRTPLMELWVATPELKEAITRGGTSEELKRAARKGGMRTLWEAGLVIVKEGVTTLGEVERVLGQTDEEVDTTPEEPDAARLRVLLVDDDAVVRTMAKTLLIKNEFDVVEAVDGQDAIDRLERDPQFDLMVLDLDMPRMRGDEVLPWIRSNNATLGLPVVVLTGSEDEESEVRLMDMGADDYIRKPLDPPRFLARVKATLRRAGVEFEQASQQS